MSEEISEACGVFAAVSTSGEDVFPLLYWGLLSLNHRGQQSYGFTTLRKGSFHKREDLNLVPTDPRVVSSLSASLRGPVGVANSRYATSGGRGTKHLQGGKQPLIVSSGRNRIAVSYNGNIVNAPKLRPELRKRFGSFKTDADTEVLARMLLLGLEESRNDYSFAVGKVLDEVEGAYSAIALDSEGSLHAFRDVCGIRPFCFARGPSLYAFASETPALDINGLRNQEYLSPGELISVTASGKITRKRIRAPKPAMCAFEFAYFSRPDSVLNGSTKPVYKIRERFARALAGTYAKTLGEQDMIISMPETADDAAYGLHEATGLPWERAVRKNRYVTRRAFISRTGERDSVIDKKVNVVPSLIEGKKLAVIEDSIVRGDTSKINIAKLRDGGAKSIDLFVTFPRITDPCMYGVDMASYGELLGSRMDEIQMAKWLGADSVNFQTIDGLVQSIGIQKDMLCLGCITGKYPTSTAQRLADSNRKNHVTPSRRNERVYEKIRSRSS